MIRLVVGLLLLLTGTAFAAGNVLPGAIEEKEGVNISLSVTLGLDALF